MGTCLHAIVYLATSLHVVYTLGVIHMLACLHPMYYLVSMLLVVYTLGVGTMGMHAYVHGVGCWRTHISIPRFEGRITELVLNNLPVISKNYQSSDHDY
jgi:hypothetical protein